MGNTRGTIHVDRPLSELSLKYKNGAMIADMISPRIAVAKESDKYFVYGKQDFNVDDDYRADKADPNWEDTWKIESTPTYVCEEHSRADLVSDRERENADAPLSPDIDTLETLTNRLMLGREKRLATILTAATTYSSSSNTDTLSGTEQWNNASFNSDSLADAIRVRIDTAKEAIRAYIGMDPNTIIIPAAVAKVVARDSEIKDYRKYTDPTLLINGDLPPQLWNMKVLVPGAIYNSANEGATFSGADVWGKNVILAYIAPNPKTPKTMTFSLTFQSKPRQVSKWREDRKKSDAIEVAEILVEKVVSEYCGYLLKDVIA